jgi:hypothetical protein
MPTMNENQADIREHLPEDERLNAFARELFELVLATEEAQFMPSQEAQITLLRQRAEAALQNPTIRAVLDSLITEITGFETVAISREVVFFGNLTGSVPPSLTNDTLIGAQEVLDNYFVPQQVNLASPDLAKAIAKPTDYNVQFYNSYTDLDLQLTAKYDSTKQAYKVEFWLYEPRLAEVFAGRWECNVETAKQLLPLRVTADNRYFLTVPVPAKWLSNLTITYRLLE